MLSRLMAATAFICSEGNSAVTNYVTQSTVLDGTVVGNPNDWRQTLRDDRHSTYLRSSFNYIGDILQIDLGATVAVQSFSMLVPYNPIPST